MLNGESPRPPPLETESHRDRVDEKRGLAARRRRDLGSAPVREHEPSFSTGQEDCRSVVGSQMRWAGVDSTSLVVRRRRVRGAPRRDLPGALAVDLGWTVDILSSRHERNGDTAWVTQPKNP